MRVADLAVGSFASLQVDDSLADAAREIEDTQVAAITICDGGVLVGILTTRDLARAVADEAPLDRTSIEEYMTVAPVIVPPETAPDEALRAMLEGGFRHLPVVDETGEVVGILRMPDVVRSLAEDGVLRQVSPAPA